MSEIRALDLTDPHVREMADRNHRPREYWAIGGHLLGLACEACNQQWPCETRKALDSRCTCPLIDTSRHPGERESTPGWDPYCPEHGDMRDRKSR